MLHIMLELQKPHNLPHIESKNEMRSVSESSPPLKNNQIKVQLHSIEDISKEDILIDQYTEILDFKKFEKLRDRLDISLRKKL